MAIDWSALMRGFEAVRSGSRAELAVRLAALEETDPDSASFLTEHFALTDDLAGFMLTRMPDRTAADEDPRGMAINDRIGPWRLEEMVGRGGMGAVWLARRDDGVYDQTAALKLLAVDNSALRERFAQERQRLAQLEHPHIARIIDGGEDAAGHPYMVMEYVKGEQIGRRCEQASADRKQRVRLLIDLCEALTHAHARLVLHLDIKSANVLVNEQGALRLIDFGIAALMSPDGRAGSAPSGRALTLLTAAPEQLEGGIVSAATDIFQVGMLGHLLLAGALPERQPNGSVKVDSRALADPDLTAIVAKATAYASAERYASADALAEDLRSWLAMLPVTARNGGGVYRMGLFIRKYWLASAATALAVMALTGGLAISLWQTQRAINARNLALAEEERSDAIRESLYFLLAETDASGEGEATISGVSRAAEVIAGRFDKAPAQYAGVLQALGELQFYLSDDVGALETFDRLLGRADTVDPVTLAQARYNAAQAHMRQGAADKAKDLLAEAQAFWQQDAGRWSLRLIDSRLLEAQVMREDQPDAAVQLLRKTLAEHIEQNGSDNQRAGVFSNNIGTALVALGRLDEAETAFVEADRVWASIGLASGFDALNTLNNLASVQYLRGEVRQAVKTFARAVELRGNLFGPSAATAALLSNYGKALSATGENAAALEQFANAEKMALQFAGEASPLTISIQLGRAEALAKKGDEGGLEQLDRARELIARINNPPPLLAAHQLALGKVHAAENRPREARNAYEAAAQLAKAAGPSADRIRSEAEQLARK